MSYIENGPYLTPEQLARKRKEAQRLQTPDFSPIESPMEGFARLAQAGVGAWKQRQLNEQISNNGMTDGAARRGLFGSGIGLGLAGPSSSGQPDTPLRALGRGIFGGPLGQEPTGLSAPAFPAPPPQNNPAMMQPAQTLGQPSFPAAPTGAAPVAALNGMESQSVVPQGVTPIAGDHEIQGKPITDLNGVTSGAPSEVPSIRDSIANALRFFRLPV